MVSAYNDFYGKAMLHNGLAGALSGMREGDPQSRKSAVELVRKYANPQINRDSPDNAIMGPAHTLLQTAYEEAKTFMSKNLGAIAQTAPQKALEKNALGFYPVIGFEDNKKLWEAHKRYFDARRKLSELEGPMTQDNYDRIRAAYIEDKAETYEKLYDKLFANVDKKLRNSLLSITLHSIGNDMIKNRMGGDDEETYANIVKHKLRKEQSTAKDDFEDEFPNSGEKYSRLALAASVRNTIRQGILTGDKEKEHQAYNQAMGLILSLQEQRN